MVFTIYLSLVIRVSVGRSLNPTRGGPTITVVIPREQGHHHGAMSRKEEENIVKYQSVELLPVVMIFIYLFWRKFNLKRSK